MLAAPRPWHQVAVAIFLHRRRHLLLHLPFTIHRTFPQLGSHALKKQSRSDNPSSSEHLPPVNMAADHVI